MVLILLIFFPLFFLGQNTNNLRQTNADDHLIGCLKNKPQALTGRNCPAQNIMNVSGLLDSIKYGSWDTVYLKWNLISKTINYRFDAQNGIASVPNVSHQITVSPNPAFGFIQLTCSGNELISNAQLFIHNMEGKLVLSQPFCGSSSIDVADLTNGIYSVTIQKKEGISNQKLVIVHS